MAATKGALGDLHEHVTRIFRKVLENYERKLDASEKIDLEELTDELLAEVIVADLEPNPAMLNAITKFLKDNDIGFDTEELDKLNEVEERLKARKNNRRNLTELGSLSLVADNT